MRKMKNLITSRLTKAETGVKRRENEVRLQKQETGQNNVFNQFRDAGGERVRPEVSIEDFRSENGREVSDLASSEHEQTGEVYTFKI